MRWKTRVQLQNRPVALLVLVQQLNRLAQIARLHCAEEDAEVRVELIGAPMRRAIARVDENARGIPRLFAGRIPQDGVAKVQIACVERGGD